MRARHVIAMVATLTLVPALAVLSTGRDVGAGGPTSYGGCFSYEALGNR